MQELLQLRNRLFVAIRKVAKCGCKHYECAMHLNMPSCFDDNEDWVLDIDLYVFGPSRRLRLESPSYEGICKQLEMRVRQYEAEAKER